MTKTNELPNEKGLDAPLVSGSAYHFNPLKHGFEPITNYPELEFNFPMIEGYYVKIVCYSTHKELVYWYKVISNHVRLKPDDRVEIISGSYNFSKPCEFGKQNTPRVEYLGLVTNDEFAKNLIKHLLGTTSNESIYTDSVSRYNENLGQKMRREFPQHYR